MNNNIKCVRPWVSLFIKKEVKNCCWQISNHGILTDTSNLDSVWNNESIQQMRQEMLESSKNGKVPEKHCPPNCINAMPIDTIKDDPKLINVLNSIEKNDIIVGHPPKFIDPVIDHVCNLKCKMCWIFKDEERDYKLPETGLSNIFHDILNKNAKYKTQCNLIGGEPFYSKYIQKQLSFLIDHDFEIGAISNLSILDIDTINRIPIGNFTNIGISVDAATSKTYKKIRGGNFNRLLENLTKLEKIISIRNSHGEYAYVWMSYMIMNSNYKEIIKAIDLYITYPFDVRFNQIMRTFDGNFEEVFDIRSKQDDVLKTLNDAVIYINNKIGVLDTQNDQSICKRYNVMKESLEDRILELEDIMANEKHLSVDVPKYDILIENKKRVEIKYDLDRDDAIYEVVESLNYINSEKFKFLKDNIDSFEIKEVSGYVHTGELDLSIYTILVSNKSYIYYWYLSIRNLLKNSDILKVKKIVVMTNDNTHDVVIEIAKLFNLPTLFDIHLHNEHDIIGNDGNSHEYFTSKASFPLNEDLTDVTFILQDCDYFATKAYDLYSKFEEYLHNSENDNKLLMFDDEFFPKEGIIKDFGRKLIGVNSVTYTDKLKNLDDIKKFIIGSGVDIDHIEKIHNDKWYNATLVGFRKNSPIIDDDIMCKFLDIKSCCDESEWLIGAAKNNISVEYISDVFNIPFSFMIDKVKDEQSFLFSAFNGTDEYFDTYSKYYIKFINE